jgi:UDPglucose--hexose-1-phosphate uridylyltransferase
VAEIRQNPVTKEWVIIATERVKRPKDFALDESEEALPRHDENCPFCPGNEDKTPPEIFSNKGKDGKWVLRVIPNKFPVLKPDGQIDREETSNFFRRMDGLGRHEVIIESPFHDATLGRFSLKETLEIVEAYKRRYCDLITDNRVKLVTIFRNNGKRAGTSLEHPHSQIVALPVVPVHVRNRLESAMRYYDDHGHCVFCRMLEMELKSKKRLVLKNDDFIAFEPFASRVPFETWIVPLKHQATFGEISKKEMKGLARILKSLFEKFVRGLHNPAYNLIVRTAPTGDEGKEYYHWHIQVIPRTTTSAGFELGTGVYINVSLPESSAEFLRKV